MESREAEREKKTDRERESYDDHLKVNLCYQLKQEISFQIQGEVPYMILGKSIASSVLPATVAVAKPLGNVFLVNGNCDGNKLRHCRFRSFDT